MIEWEETSVLACLEVEPQVDKDHVFFRYVVHRDDLTLELVVFPYADDVRIRLFKAEQKPLVDLWMRGCRAIQYVHADDERLLFLSHDGNQYRPNLPYGLCLNVRPSLRIEFGDSLAPLCAI